MVKQEGLIKTVSLDETISFMKQNVVNSKSKIGKKTTLLPDLNQISQEKITNSDQLLTVIPLSNNNKQEYSRVLLLKIKDTLKSLVFTMYPDNELPSKDFSGKIFISNINGDFTNGYRLKEGIIRKQFVKNKSNSQLTSKEGENELHEVFIDNNYRSPLHYFFLLDMMYDSFGGGGGESWDYGSSGGSGSSSTNTQPVVDVAEKIEENIDDTKLDPCPKGIMDQLKNTTNNDIKSILEKLGANNVYKIDMKMGSTAQGYA